MQIELKQLQQKPVAISAQAVAVEMMALMAYALLVGVAVALLVAMPVVLLSATAT